MNNLQKTYYQHSNLKPFLEKLGENSKNKIHLKGLLGSSKSFFIGASFHKKENQYICISEDKEQAAYLFNDMQKIAGDKKTLFFPASYKGSNISQEVKKIDQAALILRTEVLTKISKNADNYIIVTYPEAIIEPVISKEKLDSNTIEIEVGTEIDISFLEQVLAEYKFERVDFVFEPGQYAMRGSIIDIFSYSFDFPYRIDFFGDEVDSIRTFDVVSQLSKSKYDKISIIPDIQTKIEEKQIPFLDFINPNTKIFATDLSFIFDKIEDIFNITFASINNDNLEENKDFLGFLKQFKTIIENFTVVELQNKAVFNTKSIFYFDINLQPAFNKNFNLLADNLFNKNNVGFENHILSDNKKQLSRLAEIFESGEVEKKVKFIPVESVVHEGFIDNNLKLVIYTDHQIFERYHRFKLRDSSQRAAKEALTIREINNLSDGDYVVHIDHGVGVFGGLAKIEINDKLQDVIRLIYKNNDNLFVNIHSLHKISKFKGKDGEPPKIHQLGSNVWQKLKTKSKSKIKNIAKDLIKLYAKRMQEKGFAYSQDTYLQEALESSFMYEDTPDQEKTVIAIKSDMENAAPMDRLVCGDVGFGKTEIAVRAAFKAVADSKQVVVLCPTTILTFQHYNTFKDRLKDLPANIDYISRMKSAKNQKETLKRLEEGKIDIIIGTHRIVSKDVKFKNLGLLIVDEEQKFGVAVKEKLKRFKVNVDTLTLTATPIPRTLQFSLMGARDLSIIQTPPPNRYPIITELHTFNEKLIKEAIDYETQRGGQVFFVHNHKATLLKILAMIYRICPTTKPVIAHGGMTGSEMEKVIADFINEEYDVLVTTTIIENGLDISNANTIIINNAQNFGLSDLHQLRGRVGRSNKKAFCYLIAPPKTTLPDKSKRRLTAIENFAEIGSGFNIAMQDLDIRGAGNMLGGEQSGFITEIGFETYKRILEETMLELRNNDYKELFEEKDKKQNENKQIVNEEIKYISDCQITTDMDINFPNTYIHNDTEKLKLYRELDNISTENELDLFEENLIDRFGKLPKESKHLLSIVRLRWLAMSLAIEKIIIKNKKMTCFFVANQNSAFYDSELFSKNIMNFIMKNPKLCEMKQKNAKLLLKLNKIDKIEKAIKIFEKIMN